MHELSKGDAMTSKENGVHSKPSVNEFGWWWQKENLDNIEGDIEDAVMRFKIKFKREPLHGMIFGPEASAPLLIKGLQIWQDPKVPENVVILQ